MNKSFESKLNKFGFPLTAEVLGGGGGGGGGLPCKNDGGARRTF